jgi:hypothetical protein
MDKETIMKANAKNNEMNQTTDEHHGMLTYVGTTTGRQWKNAEIGWTWLDKVGHLIKNQWGKTEIGWKTV